MEKIMIYDYAPLDNTDVNDKDMIVPEHLRN